MSYISQMIKRRDELKRMKDILESKLEPIEKEYHNIVLFLHQMNELGDVYSNESKNDLKDYPMNSSLNEKIKYILKVKDKATISQIEKYINEYDDKSISKGYVAVTISGLYNSGEIKVIGKEGRANIYSL